MRIHIDLMPNLRAEATQRINGYYDSFALGLRMQAQSRKQQVAHEVIGGAAAPAAFQQEAALRELSSEEFARLILSKPHPIDALEIERQRLLIAIDRAVTPDDLEAITI